jgi:uncharacterized protein (TIGR03437 family)
LANWANVAVTGTVDFTRNGSPLTGCTGVSVQNGAALCTTTFPQLGGLTLGARYNGDANTSPSNGSLPLSVGKVAPSPYLAAAPTAPIFGAPVTITTLVLGANGVAAPTGNVTFRDGSNTLATVPLNASGQAVLVAPSSSVPAFSAGAHAITATYNGDANYAPSAPVSLTLPVGKAATVVSLSAEPGGPFVATVAAQAPGSGTPTGSVQFLRNGAPFATVPLAQPGPSATVAASSQGGNISAAYAGDSNFTGSTAAPVAVAAPQATLLITSDHNPSSPSQGVNFTVYVSPIVGTATPTGAVQLSADGTSLGTARLNAAQATFTTSLAAGTHALAASYAGDAVYPSASAAYSQIVSKTAATLTLSADLQAAVFGQAVTLTAKLSADSGQPNRNISFSDGLGNLGAAALSAGTASLTVTNLPVGQHLITVSWPGDSNWSPATSQAALLSISKAQTTTNLTTTPTSFNIAVAAVPPGAGTPTGSIRLTDATTHAVLATAALNNGSATVAVPSGASAAVAEYSGDSSFLTSASSSVPELTATNAASYATDRFAPDEIVTLFGNNLASATASGGAQPQTVLGGTSVQVADANGKNHAAALLFVSPSQVSLVLPPEVAPGSGTVSVSNAGGVTAGSITVGNVAPGLFTVSGTGQGAPAGQTVRVHADGSVDSPQELAAFDAAQNLWTPVPIDLSATGDTVYLVLYGTGFRHFSSVPICSIAGQSIPASFAGAQGTFAGLDQVNVPLPPTLQGIGTTTLTLNVDGVTSNPITLAFQ